MSIEVSSDTLIEAFTVLGQEKWAVLKIDLAITVIAVGASLLIPDTYTAKSLLLPPQQGQSSAGSALAALGVISTTLGGSANLKTPEELYVSLLKSDSVADALIERFKLGERYGTTSLVESRKLLARKVLVAAERKSGLVSVEADDHDPEFAARLANGFSDELRRLMDRIAITEASQRRKFFEEEAERAKRTLAEAELALKATQEVHGIQSIDTRAQGDMRAGADLRAQIMTREIQIQAMRAFAGPENADLQRLGAEVASMRSQLIKVEQGAGPDGTKPEAALATLRAYREVKYQEAILASLITQAEVARSDEARQAPMVQQVDVARPPDRKSYPRRSWIALGAAATGLLVGVIVVLARRSWRRSQEDPESAQRWQAVRDAWRVLHH